MHISQQPWFSRIQRPSRYLGGEVHSTTKDPADVEVSIALAFPDVYEIGMSHVGLKILYHLLNSKNWLSAERVFAVWIDLEHELKKRGIPLTSLESGRPLSEFDIVGFSLQHELCYTNVLSMLDLAHIPLLSEERGSKDPLIIAGGPACFNPESVAALFDAIVIGDGEQAAVSVCKAVREWKRDRSKSKLELLQELSKIEGVYIPSFFSIHYNTKGLIKRIDPLREGYCTVDKAIVADLNSHPFPSKQIIPFVELVHDRFTVEIARGCSRGCRFCQAGMIYRPVRERDPREIVRIAESGLRKTGFEDFSMLSLSSGDYSCVLPLARELMARIADRHVALSFSSLRADGDFSLLMEEIKKVRKTSFTVAPEAGSQRMRDVINKGLTEDQILHAAREIYEGGWSLIKLYFMIGLPCETDSDLMAIVELSKKISRLAPRGRGRNVLNVSISSFVPKAHTPFQWLPQIELEESRRRIAFIKEKLQSRRVRVKWNNADAAWLEGIFSRGDRRLTKVLVEAWKKGARFDSWSEHMNLDAWQGAFETHGVDPNFYLLRQRAQDEILPWEHINSGICREFLLGEWQKAMRGEITPSCKERCSHCGVCTDFHVSPIVFSESGPFKERAVSRPIAVGKEIRRFRLHFSKLEQGRYLSHLELVKSFIRAFRRAGLGMVYSHGYHPMPKASFAKALPVGVESLDEIVEVSLYDNEDPAHITERINRELPPGIRILSIREVGPKEPSPLIRESDFHIKARGPFNREDVIRFLRLPSCSVVQRHGDKERTIDIRSQVKALRLMAGDELELTTRHGIGPEMKPAEIIKEVFALSDAQVEVMRVLKTRSVLS
jgi:radical SAM family uncharacterized protein/radical SAM-linked protein